MDKGCNRWIEHVKCPRCGKEGDVIFKHYPPLDGVLEVLEEFYSVEFRCSCGLIIPFIIGSDLESLKEEMKNRIERKINDPELKGEILGQYLWDKLGHDPSIDEVIEFLKGRGL